MRMAALLAPLVVVGCRAEDTSASPAADERMSARFVETLRYVNEGAIEIDSSRGEFDWEERRGWASTGAGNLIRQVGGDCFERVEEKLWRRWQVDEPGDLCPLFPPNPARSLDELLPGADFERLGSEEIMGVETTHFRAVADEQAAWSLPELDEGPIDVWVDERTGLLHQWRQSNLSSVALDKVELDYLDFGVVVDVKAPPNAQVVEVPPLATGVTPEEARQAACGGSYDKGKPAYCYKGDK